MLPPAARRRFPGHESQRSIIASVALELRADTSPVSTAEPATAVKGERCFNPKQSCARH